MTDRLERFENVVGQLSKVAPDAWEGMVAYEQVSAVTSCAVMFSAYLGMLAMGLVLKFSMTKAKKEPMGDHEGLAFFAGCSLVVGVPILTIALWGAFPKSVATVLHPEAALVTKMVGP